MVGAWCIILAEKFGYTLDFSAVKTMWKIMFSAEMLNMLVNTLQNISALLTTCNWEPKQGKYCWKRVNTFKTFDISNKKRTYLPTQLTYSASLLKGKISPKQLHLQENSTCKKDSIPKIQYAQQTHYFCKIRSTCRKIHINKEHSWRLPKSCSW